MVNPFAWLRAVIVAAWWERRRIVPDPIWWPPDGSVIEGAVGFYSLGDPGPLVSIMDGRAAVLVRDPVGIFTAEEE